MWGKIRVIFTIPELRQKVVLTLVLLAIYRVGWQIPLPIIDHTKMTAFFSKGTAGGLGDIFNQVSLFSASNLNQATIFGLGIMPYISASIIFQLLGSVYPPLEKLQKEGETGRSLGDNAWFERGRAEQPVERVRVGNRSRLQRGRARRRTAALHPCLARQERNRHRR